MTPLHQAALDYAARGIPVFPIVPGTKKPACEHSFKDATTDPAIITAWWTGADYNIGTEPGAWGHVVVDIDDKKGHQGSKSWAALCPEADTFMVRTPSGGYHAYFKGSLSSSAGKLGDGLDVRGVGGYVLLPPSFADGAQYHIALDNPILDLPPILAELLDKPKREPAKAPEGVELDPEGIEDWACALIEATILQDGPAVVGANLNERTVALAMRLGDGPQYGYAVSENSAVCVMLRHWSNEARVEEAIHNAYNSRQNPLGCGQYGSASRKYDPLRGEPRPYDPEPALVVWPEQEAATYPIPVKRAGLISGGSLIMEPVKWIWPGWLASGKFHVLGGQKGAGKSTITFSLLAQITVGGRWPDGTNAPLGDVLIWSGEDDARDTILPRLVSAGGDRNRVWFPDRVSLSDGSRRHFDPALDMAGLLEDCRSLPSLQVIVIDPIVSASAGDSHKNAETRRGLQPIVDFAEETGAAVIGITHFTKGTKGQSPIERITGSLAFGAMPRVVWGAAKSEDEAAARVLVRIESNIGKSGGGYEYLLQQSPVPGQNFLAQCAVWGSHLEGSAREIIDGLEGEGQGGKRLQAVMLLQSLLTPAGNAGVLVKEIKAAAEAHGISWPTVERAKAKMGTIEAIKNQGGSAPPWSWRLMASD